MSDGDGGWTGHRMPTDSVGLAYALRGGRIYVHYPMHETGRNTGSRYGTGFDIGPIPHSYWSDPPNEITRERARIWRALLESGVHYY